MMKILYTNFHRSTTFGGHSIYISRLAQNLADRYSITVAAPPGCGLLRLAGEIPNVNTFPVDFTSRVYRMIAPARKLRLLLLKENFDIIHVNGSSDHKLVILASLFLKKKPKIVFTKHNDQPISAVNSLIRAWLGTDRVIAVCGHVQKKLAATPMHGSVFQPSSMASTRSIFNRWLMTISAPSEGSTLAMSSPAE